MNFVPCSPAHRHCSKSHAELVRGYREERERQEMQLDGLRGGDLEYIDLYIKEDLIVFKTWLVSNTNRSVQESG